MERLVKRRTADSVSFRSLAQFFYVFEVSAMRSITRVVYRHGISSNHILQIFDLYF